MSGQWARSFVTAAMVATACVGPSRTPGDYREKAANSAQAMRSSVQTARLVAEAELEGEAPSRYTALVLRESEDDATSVSQTFSSVQPPSEEVDRLRERTTRLLDDAVTTLTELRIAVRRDDDSQIRELTSRLAQLSRRLEHLTRITPT